MSRDTNYVESDSDRRKRRATMQEASSQKYALGTTDRSDYEQRLEWNVEPTFRNANMAAGTKVPALTNICEQISGARNVLGCLTNDLTVHADNVHGVKPKNENDCIADIEQVEPEGALAKVYAALADLNQQVELIARAVHRNIDLA